MRVAYLDCFSGISGDMFLGAMLDAGVPLSLLQEAVVSLQVDARIESRRVTRSGISAIKVDVIGPDGPDLPGEALAAKHGHDERHTHGDPHGHPQAQDPTQINADGHHHNHADDHPHGGASHHGRGLREIREIIANSGISEPAKATAIAIFEVLGAAEAKVHHQPIENIHFHEVGAVDAMVDIVCAAVGAEALGVDAFFCSPLNVGGGTVVCTHGTLPVPVPATVELLRGAPVYSNPLGPQKELVTPTGAAIVRVLVKEFRTMPAMTIERAGYGAGFRDFTGYANVLRLTIGSLTPDQLSATHSANLPQFIGELHTDTVSILEANLDDVSPQIIGYVLEKALEQGALDAFTTAVQMKKSRPGTLLTLLSRPEDVDHLTRLLLTETSTLGVRQRTEQRTILARHWEEVQTPWGTVRIKIGSLDGKEVNFAPEFEDCRRLAQTHGVPLKQVMQAASAAWIESTSAVRQGDTAENEINR